ncbi:MAG: hypothetical protein WC734_04935 [Patescibacteria group bacterium]|jgi:hypothetical protein
MRCELEFLVLLLIARWCKISQHSAVSKTVFWKAIIAMGPFDEAILFTELGEPVDPQHMAPRLEVILDHMAETRQSLIDVVDGYISVRPLGQDRIDATSDFTAYEPILERLTSTIPTLTAV